LIGVRAVESDWISPAFVEEGAISDQIEYVTIFIELGGLEEVNFGCLKISYSYYS
jgi:hypothetical protein